MPIEGTSQDSRDPNSPQWGYVKVKNPEKQLQYPAKDENWNEYVMFVYDDETTPEDRRIPLDTRNRIPPRTGLECVMVPATLTINCNQLSKDIKAAENACKDKNIKAELTRTLKHIKDGHVPNSGTISLQKGVADETTVWVALVIGPE